MKFNFATALLPISLGPREIAAWHICG